MATYFARKAGNINASDVWATTPSGTAGAVTFASGDILMANSFAITVNVSTTVGEVRNDNANSATAGGSFNLSNGVTLTANPFAGTVACVIFSGTAGNSATLVGNPTGGIVNAAHGANNASTGTLTITGNVTGGMTQTSIFGANNASSGTLNITGNVTVANSGVTCHGANNASTGTLTITGNVISGTAANTFGANNASTGTLTIIGNATGGSGTNAYGCNNASTGTMTVIGTINASEFNEGVGGTNRGQTTLLTGPFISSTTFGVSPIACKAWRWAESLNDQTYITVPTNNLLATRNLVTPDNATNFPAESNVRNGTSYGISGALVGTCIVPNPASVASGVGVDATIGTLTTPTANEIRDAVWAATASSLTTAGSIGERLKNSATISTTGEQLAIALTAP